MFELKLDDEEGRVRALERLDILDSEEDAVFENVATLVRQVLKVPMSGVSLIDRRRHWFKARRGIGVQEFARELSFCARTIDQPDVLLITDARADPLYAEHPFVVGEPHVVCYAGIPLTTPDGYNIGSLCAMGTAPRAFTPEEVGILSSLARILIDSIELRQTASSDALTGAMNRRGWMTGAKSELRRAARYRHPVSLAIMDIDMFKSVNDTWGHPAGDIVIAALADLTMDLVRDSDLFGRLGGEEFALLMPETSPDQAAAAAERIRASFESLPLDIRKGRPITCTVSIGVTSLCAPDDTLEQMLERADQALYHAKSGGRNRVTCSSE
ncbi:sensor domain-containing diguanylate cyclase [Halomonas sp.]|uniref:sensor domain-containing diguanylate cyclase n=1 Tax=Halomonas sp. TaxID=1486246 RepID=UPI00298E6B04|nr:sensor domain-containing diguanylate cyclase [Halomonas sp.]MDW7745920.1 sensor domain-containing diguanylate cyclase [Halomonas sp.]